MDLLKFTIFLWKKSNSFFLLGLGYVNRFKGNYVGVIPSVKQLAVPPFWIL